MKGHERILEGEKNPISQKPSPTHNVGPTYIPWVGTHGKFSVEVGVGVVGWVGVWILGVEVAVDVLVDEDLAQLKHTNTSINT